MKDVHWTVFQAYFYFPTPEEDGHHCHKRSRQVTFSDEQCAKVGKYAMENADTLPNFKPEELYAYSRESTIRSFKSTTWMSYKISPGSPADAIPFMKEAW